MSAESDRLYNLLPVIYRLRDAEQGEPLRALLSIINGELANVEADIAGLYENWFIESSDEWVVPYIGDLLGVRGLNTIQTSAFSQRAYVGNTLFYRRRKGTAYVLAILAGSRGRVLRTAPDDPIHQPPAPLQYQPRLARH